MKTLEVVHVFNKKQLIVVADNAGRHTVLEVIDKHLPYKCSSIKAGLKGIEPGETIRIITQQSASPVLAKVVKTGLSAGEARAALGPGIQIHDWEP